MSDAYVGEIRMFAGNFAPVYWALCQGQLLPIAEFTSLFAVIGNYYGGDGRSTFALPDLRSRVPMGNGTGPGLTPRRLGTMLGYAEVPLQLSQLPAHTHTVSGVNAEADQNNPGSDLLPAKVASLYGNANPGNTTLGAETLEAQGGGQTHQNMMRTTAVSYIMCLTGLFPSRN